MAGNFPRKSVPTNPVHTSPTTLRRARPLLGTMVDISCWADDPQACLHATEQAFAAVAQVHALMSRHESSSELSALNRLAPGAWMAAAPQTLAVLGFAQSLSAQTEGVFDVFTTSENATLQGCWRDLEMDLINHSVRKHAALQADLGGIAKGYAVDLAVSALQSAGASQGWVNAGGDLRVFGPLKLPLQVRAPWDAGHLVDCGVLQNQSAATSASYWLGAPLLRHGLTRKPATASASYTVVATQCIAADALTKVLAAHCQALTKPYADTHADTHADAPGRAYAALLGHYQANAWVLQAPAETMAAHV